MRRYTIVLTFLGFIGLGQGAMAGRAEPSTKGATLHVTESAYGLGCAESKAIVEKGFLDIKGVKTADVDFQAATVSVRVARHPERRSDGTVARSICDGDAVSRRACVVTV